MSHTHFTKTDRLEISVLLKKGYSHREIGRALGKDHSSVGREIQKRSVHGIYDPHKAHQKAQVKRSNSKYQGMKIRKHKMLERYIRTHIRRYWAPEQIAGRWNKRFGKKKKIRVSAPSIYKYLYSPFGQSLCRYLPSKQYRPEKRSGKKKGIKQLIPNRKSIEKRPQYINQRKKFGHWEGDTLGKKVTEQETVAGAVERKSRYAKFRKISQLKYAVCGYRDIVDSQRRAVSSFTFDNGVENVHHESLGIETYFCHPYASWEKGSIENTFLRLRRFIPKKISLTHISESRLKWIERIMNNTPRKCLKWDTPQEMYDRYMQKLEQE